MFNVHMKRLYKSELRLVPFTIAITVTILFILPDQTSWAAIIYCPTGTTVCNGTSADDTIVAITANLVIHGLAGNDNIFGYGYGHNYIFGDDGNDMLIGGTLSDGLYGGRGDDKYDGLEGEDTIYEVASPEGYVISNDVISGGLDDDFIIADGGADIINGGPGNDQIYPNSFHRDFSPDSVDCGSGTDHVHSFYSGDKETAKYCEFVDNADG
jgi:RTX calcium-binding nonapeptide repeat (4 copies)